MVRSTGRTAAIVMAVLLGGTGLGVLRGCGPGGGPAAAMEASHPVIDTHAVPSAPVTAALRSHRADGFAGLPEPTCPSCQDRPDVHAAIAGLITAQPLAVSAVATRLLGPPGSRHQPTVRSTSG